MTLPHKTLILEPENYSPEALELYQALGQLVFLQRNEDPLQSRHITDANIVVVRLRHQLDRSFLQNATQLKYIVTPTTGLDHIDLKMTEEKGIQVIALKGETEYLDSVVATVELTWGLLLSLTRNISTANQSVLNGEWNRDRYIGFDLRGKTLGIIGCGRIGKKIAAYAKTFGMKVLAHDIQQLEHLDGIIQVSQTELLKQSNVVSIHLPLEKETEGYVDDNFLQTMPCGAVIVNTSRGKIIDESALLKSLETGHLGGAATDVLDGELMFKTKSDVLSHKLVNYAQKNRNLIITPHIGGASYDAMRDTEVFVARKLLRIIKEEEQ